MPGGLHRNKKFRLAQIEPDPACPAWLVDIFFDPQTAGGLLIALPAGDAETLLGKMRAAGMKEAAIVGEITASSPGKIRITRRDHR